MGGLGRDKGDVDVHDVSMCTNNWCSLCGNEKVMLACQCV